jgi:hypothetical protein
MDAPAGKYWFMQRSLHALFQIRFGILEILNLTVQRRWHTQSDTWWIRDGFAEKSSNAGGRRSPGVVHWLTVHACPI